MLTSVYSYLDIELEQVEARQQINHLKMNILQAIQYTIEAWEEITAETIVNAGIILGFFLSV